MARAPFKRRRVVVTGLGCVTPLGGNVATTWDAALAGRSGVGEITRFDAADFPVRFAAECRGDLDLGDLPAKEVRRLDRSVALSLAAVREALADADLVSTPETRDRMGVAIGSGIGGLGTLEKSFKTLFDAGPRRVSAFTIPMAICNMSSGYAAIRHQLRGPNLCAVGACASGSHGIGEAMRAIERGDADVMVAGGAEAPITQLAVAGFANMRALSMREGDWKAASRPFDLDRDGFVVAEGGAVLVLEELEYARARGARIVAHALGYAATADASHIAQPAEDGEGARRCMQLALADAGLSPADVDHINPHATSTPVGDRVEAQAIRKVFGHHADAIPVSATKSMTGHLLGAAGALEALLCVRALETGWLPPTINLDGPDPECDLDHVARRARQQRARVAMSNSFGFGGTNATLILAADEC
jgi:3-oxoacyl-[acyl-carrier-protein] synthase II